jgi:hypothetical protein
MFNRKRRTMLMGFDIFNMNTRTNAYGLVWPSFRKAIPKISHSARKHRAAYSRLQNDNAGKNRLLRQKHSLDAQMKYLYKGQCTICVASAQQKYARTATFLRHDATQQLTLAQANFYAAIL